MKITILVAGFIGVITMAHFLGAVYNLPIGFAPFMVALGALFTFLFTDYCITDIGGHVDNMIDMMWTRRRSLRKYLRELVIELTDARDRGDWFAVASIRNKIVDTVDKLDRIEEEM